MRSLTQAYNDRHLLTAINQRFGGQRRFVTFSELSAMPPQQHNNLAVLRFDVERDLQHHLSIARQLNTRSVPASFYFHTRRECYDPQVLQTFVELGHEVGYHHECLDRCRGDFANARELFLREVDLFRQDGFECRTVCSHGEASLRIPGYRKNFDLFSRYPDLLTEAGVDAEVYQWLKSHPVVHAADTLNTYRSFWQTLEKASHQPHQPLMLLAHLHRWRTNPLHVAWEIGQDLWQQTSNRLRSERTYDLAY